MTTEHWANGELISVTETEDAEVIPILQVAADAETVEQLRLLNADAETVDDLREVNEALFAILDNAVAELLAAEPEGISSLLKVGIAAGVVGGSQTAYQALSAFL